MKKELWYAVNKDGRGNIFTSLPVRNEHFGIWEGSMESCFAGVVAVLEAEGLKLPNITSKDNPVKLSLSLEIVGFQ